jgi:hypothetical protein
MRNCPYVPMMFPLLYRGFSWILHKFLWFSLFYRWFSTAQDLSVAVSLRSPTKSTKVTLPGMVVEADMVVELASANVGISWVEGNWENLSESGKFCWLDFSGISWNLMDIIDIIVDFRGVEWILVEFQRISHLWSNPFNTGYLTKIPAIPPTSSMVPPVLPSVGWQFLWLSFPSFLKNQW